MHTDVEMIIGIVVFNAQRTKPMVKSPKRINLYFHKFSMVTDSIAKKWFKQLLMSIK